MQALLLAAVQALGRLGQAPVVALALTWNVFQQQTRHCSISKWLLLQRLRLLLWVV
jgi:hypothetical protein